MGVFLALRKLEYASCRPLFGLPSVVGSPKHCYSYSPCALDHEYGPDVAHEALKHTEEATPKSLIIVRGFGEGRIVIRTG